MKSKFLFFAPIVCCFLLLPRVQAQQQDSQAPRPPENPRRVAEVGVFTGVKVRFARDKDHLLVDKDADLVLDDSARHLISSPVIAR